MHDRDRARTTGADKDRAAGRQAAAGPPVVRAGRRWGRGASGIMMSPWQEIGLS
ncbi:hypothetical protein ACMZ5F_02675 [Streptomyces rhizosphaericola]|uniref:hypothetical protein n=1 Tax=Streptomyces rhizosphaericola TaxID=2564098 RepID=UPI0039EF0071